MQPYNSHTEWQTLAETCILGVCCCVFPFCGAGFLFMGIIMTTSQLYDNERTIGIVLLVLSPVLLFTGGLMCWKFFCAKAPTNTNMRGYARGQLVPVAGVFTRSCDSTSAEGYPSSGHYTKGRS